MAAISVTLAGFSGLVAAFRRGDELRTIDVFHLRGIAESGLANSLLSLMTIPIATIAGDLGTAVRITGSVALAFVIFQISVFTLRQRRMSVHVARSQAVGFAALDLVIVALAIATISLMAVGAYELLLLLLLARPMWDFVRVLRDIVSPRGE